MSWENNIRRVVPYTPGEQPKQQNIVKLNTNENPYPPAPGAAEVLAGFDTALLRKYPDPNAQMLVDAIAKTYGVRPGQVFVGVGSDDVLSMAFMTFFNSEKPILFPDVTYSFYDVWADVYRIPYETVPLDADWRIRPNDYARPNGGIVFPNPNAPTGVLESLDTIEQILQANPDSIVIVDEAYIDFGGVSALPLLDKYDNLLVVQTFSKSRSMAGIRIGFAIGSEKLIGYMNDVKFSVNSYTMNHLTIQCGAASLADEPYFRDCCGRIVKTREAAKEKLASMGFSFPDSKANFLFATHETVDAGRIFEALKQRSIFVRHWDKPRIAPYLRITIGTDEEMAKLYAALEDILREEAGK